MKISITPSAGRSAVVGLSCGSSNPKLDGSVNIGNFPNLTAFKCNNNDVSTVIGLNNCTKIQVLDLSANKLSGNLPTSLSAFPDLKRLLLTSNLLSSAPAIHANNTNLQYFGTNANTITATIDNLDNFILPNLTDYRINGVTTPSVVTNSYTGSIPTLSTCSKLQYFIANNTKLSNLPPKLSSSSLINFTAAANPLNCFISQDFFTLTPKIDVIALHTCGVSCTQLPTLTANTSLTQFYMYQPNSTTAGINLMGLSGTIPTLSSCTKLRLYQVQRNYITDFTLSPLPSSFFVDGTYSNNIFHAFSNAFTKTAMYNCLQSFYTQLTSVTAALPSYFPNRVSAFEIRLENASDSNGAKNMYAIKRSGGDAQDTEMLTWIGALTSIGWRVSASYTG